MRPLFPAPSAAPLPRRSEAEGVRREQPGALLARRTRTIRMCSLGTRARHGALRVGRVRMSRAVKGTLGHST